MLILADGVDGVLLADDPLMELVLHGEELLGLLLGELVDRDAGPHREHLGDGLLVDLVEQVLALRLQLGLAFVLAGLKLLFRVAQAAGLLEVLGLDGGLLALDDLGQVVLDFGSLVGEQGALIESIEHHVQRSANFVGKGADALQESKGLHRALQKKRLILAGIICGGAAVVLIVVLLVLNQVLPSFRIGGGGGRRQPPALAPGPAPDWVPVRAPDPNPSPPG